METQLDLLINSTLYCKHESTAQLLGRAETLMQSYKGFLRFLILNSKKDVFKELKGAAGEYQFTENTHSKNILSGQLHRTYGRYEKKELLGKLVLFTLDVPDIYIVLTHESGEAFKNGIFRFFRSEYPKISLPFFSSWQIKYFLDNLQKGSPNDTIIITGALLKSRIESPRARKFKETDRTWTDLPYKEFFEQTTEHNAWVDKVEFDIDSEEMRTIKGVIGRDGRFAWHGNLKLFLRIILENAVQESAKDYKKLSGRSRSKQHKFKARPLFIEYDTRVFANKEQNKKLIRALKKLPYSANSIIHENPYLHMTITDYLDGSSCDIWVLSISRISIVPQTVCSASSLNRICSSIFRDFMEGKIKDMSEVSI